jgi:hypothetical protein
VEGIWVPGTATGRVGDEGVPFGVKEGVVVHAMKSGEWNANGEVRGEWAACAIVRT